MNQLLCDILTLLLAVHERRGLCVCCIESCDCSARAGVMSFAVASWNAGCFCCSTQLGPRGVAGEGAPTSSRRPSPRFWRKTKRNSDQKITDEECCGQLAMRRSAPSKPRWKPRARVFRQNPLLSSHAPPSRFLKYPRILPFRCLARISPPRLNLLLLLPAVAFCLCHPGLLLIRPVSAFEARSRCVVCMCKACQQGNCLCKD